MTLPHSAALANLARIGKLKAEPPDARERAGLLRSATVRLQDALQTTLSLESRFDLAYNAAHAAALSARNVPVVAITDSAFSPLAQSATVWFEAAEGDFSGFRSLSGTMALAMALTVSVAEKRRNLNR